MTYTPPTSATALGTLTVTKYNTEIKDNIEHLYSYGTALGGSVTNIYTQPIGTVTTSGTSYTIVNSDNNKLLMSTAGTAGTVVIPADTLTSGGSFAVGQSLSVAQMGTGQITISGMASAVANGTTTVRATPSNIIRAQYSVVTLMKIASNEWLLIGDLQ